MAKQKTGMQDAESSGEIGLEHVVYELRMIRKEMEGYYSNLMRAEELMLTSWRDFFSLWMETVKHDRLRGHDLS